MKNKIMHEYRYESSRSPKAGDVVFCRRKISLYKHFGVYIGNGRIIHFAPQSGDKGSDAVIHETTWGNFAEGDKVCVMNFPEKYESGSFLRSFVHSSEYHLYSPSETVQRAKSMIGKKGVDCNGYNFLVNNCESFAIWCKTGISESKQVCSWLDAMLP